MKLGVSYIVFDGVELLESSIRQIRQHVNYLSVIYQTRSWFGKEIQTDDLAELNRLKSIGLIDELVLFKDFVPLANKNSQSIRRAKHYELSKRQFGLVNCLKKGCNYYLCLDVDEFYKTDEFARAKFEIIEKGYTSTAVRFINYVKEPTIHRGYDSMRVPFICKIDATTKMSNQFFVKCDPTRGINNGSRNNHEFSHKVITMHHMESVRKNLHAKYDSTTRAIFQRNQTGELVKSIRSVNSNSQFVDFKRIIFPGINKAKLNFCENFFNIPYTTWNQG